MSVNPTGRPHESELGWQSIRVQNLRSLEDSGEVEYARMTLFFGKNSSGKTSLLRAPLLLKQAVFSSESNEAILSGPFVDFGSYRDMVFNHEVKRDVRLSAVLATPPKTSLAILRRTTPELAALFSRMHVEITFHWNHLNSSAQYQSITFSNPETKKEVVRFDRCSPQHFDVRMKGRRILRVDVPLSPPALRYAEIGIVRDDSRENEKVRNLSFLMYQLDVNLRRGCNQIIHIPPLREMPSRAYRIEQLPSAAASDSAVAVLRSGEGLKQIERALQTLGMAKSISVPTLAPGFEAVAVQDPATGRVDNLADVGFGVSQVLPIVAALATAQPNTTVLIEQPELHLHPEAQGNLADVLYSLASSRNLRLVIETHSEHILLRLQRRIAEQKMPLDDLRLYFVDSGRVSLSGVDRHGQLDNSVVPAGFFEEDWRDMLKLTEAAAKVSLGD